MKTTNLKTNLLRVLCVAIVTFSLHACGGSSDPIAVAEQFAEAYCDADFDKCNKLMFEDAKNRFVPSAERSEAEKQFFKMIQEQTRKMKYKLKLNKEQTEVEEERAEVVFDTTSATETSFNEEFIVKLKKDDKTGKWLVSKYNNPF